MLHVSVLHLLLTKELTVSYYFRALLTYNEHNIRKQGGGGGGGGRETSYCVIFDCIPLPRERSKDVFI